MNKRLDEIHRVPGAPLVVAGSESGNERIATHEDSYPKKRISAGAIICNAKHELLIVKPTYREGWLLPGGIAEHGESPAVALSREVIEELGQPPEIVRLLCVDYLPESSRYSESIHFLFECVPWTHEQSQAIRIDTSELSEFRFCTWSEAVPLLVPAIAARLAHRDVPGTSYLENGRPLFGYRDTEPKRFPPA